MKATYIGTGARDDDLVCSVFGRDFPLNEPVDVSDLPEAHDRLRGNPTFVVDEPATKGKAKADADTGL